MNNSQNSRDTGTLNGIAGYMVTARGCPTLPPLMGGAFVQILRPLAKTPNSVPNSISQLTKIYQFLIVPAAIRNRRK